MESRLESGTLTPSRGDDAAIGAAVAPAAQVEKLIEKRARPLVKL
jgi:hypothetical protein